MMKDQISIDVFTCELRSHTPATCKCLTEYPLGHFNFDFCSFDGYCKFKTGATLNIEVERKEPEKQ